MEESIGTEEEEVKRFVEKSNTPDNRRKLKNHGYNPPMRRSYYNLLRILVFLLIAVVIVLIYRTYYPSDFVPTYNSTCEINISQVCGDCNTEPCPDNICDVKCDCPNFPNKINLNGEMIIKNESG